jgi:hypothetical protein
MKTIIQLMGFVCGHPEGKASEGCGEREAHRKALPHFRPRVKTPVRRARDVPKPAFDSSKATRRSRSHR